MGKSVPTKKLSLVLPVQVRTYLADLARIGILGTSEAEVGRALISRGIEEQIKSGMIEKRGNDRQKSDE